MTEWRAAHAFALEAAKREIENCTDVKQLRKVCLNLLLQTEALKEMTQQLLLRP